MIAAVIWVSSLISKKKNSKALEVQTSAENTSDAPVQEAANMPVEAIEEVPVAAVMAEAVDPSEQKKESENDAGEGGAPEVTND